MVARSRPPRRAANPAAGYKAKSSSKKAGSGGVTNRARDKTRGQGARLYNDPFNDERQLEAQLKRLGLYAANTLGDGSCLFRSLSDQLHGTPNHHLSIRHEVCNFLLAHRDEYIAFIDDSNHSSPEGAYGAHVAEMRNSATYGTQLEIVAFARMTKRRIKVIQAELVYVIGFEDESPDAKASREAKQQHARSDSKGKAKEIEEELPDLYIVYHNWEHYSSARNIAGPHAGLPCIVEQQQPMPGAVEDITAEDISKATQEESLILSSLRYPHRHSITEIRKLIHDSGGSWETALESLLENEVDETESEDFNQPTTPQSPNTPPLPPSIGITAATPGMMSSNPPPRSSSPSASSSTATSATNNSQSTNSTQLSDLIERDRNIKTSISPLVNGSTSSTKKIRSRAASPDAEFEAAESPRQRFRLSTDTADNASSCGGDDVATTASVASSVGGTPPSSIAGSAQDEAEDINSSCAPTPPPRAGTADSQSPHVISPMKSNRFPKRRDALAVSPRGPTRRQRKQAIKSGTPLGVQTRSKVSTANQETGLQREFKELYV